MAVAFCLLAVIVFAIGAYWCFEVIRRFSSDLEEFKTSKDNVRKGVTVFVWVLTIAVAYVTVRAAIFLIAMLYAAKPR